MGLPVLRALSLCTCCRQYPGAAAERRLRSSHPAVSAFPEIAVGSACTSSFSRLARRSLALRPAHSRRHLYVTRYTEGFSHFVTSMTAPVASGWSVRRVGLSPTGKRRLLTAHANSGHCPRARQMCQVNPEQTSPVGRTNGRQARKSNLRLKARSLLELSPCALFSRTITSITAIRVLSSSSSAPERCTIASEAKAPDERLRPSRRDSRPCRARGTRLRA